MDTNPAPELSDRQARATILTAESIGFEREPDLYPAWYDHLLHEDAAHAAEYLCARDPQRLEAALASDEPIPAQCAALRITEGGHFSFADAETVLHAAVARGFEPPQLDLPCRPDAVLWEQARAAVAHFWDHDPAVLDQLLGEHARLAPLPDTARISEHGCGGTWRSVGAAGRSSGPCS